MENSEVSVSSNTARTWHDFLDRMRQPSATEFVKQIKSFIVSLSNNAPDPERDAASVQEFLSSMEANFRAHPLWAGRTEEELDSAVEGLEKYMMTKLFTRVFASHPDDIKIDNEFNKKSALIQQFIHPDHLEIQPVYQKEASWSEAEKELLKINGFKAPRDKLACIMSCCKVISNSMFTGNSNPPGADEFLPVLIYITIKANPPRFHSNLMYIQRYRNKCRLLGEAAYVFTNMLSAESFILNIDAKSLSMNETEFLKNMESAQIVVSGLSGDYNDENMQSESSQGGQIESLSKVLSVSDLENRGASMLVTDEKVSEKLENFRYLYAESGDLTVGDVEELLTGYKQLVFKYVCLAKGMDVPVVQPKTQAGGGTRDDGGIEGGREGLGVAESSSESQIGSGTEGALEGEGSMELGGGMVDVQETDTHVDAVRVEGGGDDGDVGASTHDSTVTREVGFKINEDAEK